MALNAGITGSVGIGGVCGNADGAVFIGGVTGSLEATGDDLSLGDMDSSGSIFWRSLVRNCNALIVFSSKFKVLFNVLKS